MNAGRQPLSAASPNKTREGLIGGCVVAFVITAFVAAVFGLGPIDTLAEGMLVGLVIAVVAPLGDLCESLVKRDLGLKDMGTVLPGHGGLMDRFDALLFVLPAVWLLATTKTCSLSASSGASPPSLKAPACGRHSADVRRLRPDPSADARARLGVGSCSASRRLRSPVRRGRSGHRRWTSSPLNLTATRSWRSARARRSRRWPRRSALASQGRRPRRRRSGWRAG